MKKVFQGGIYFLSGIMFSNFLWEFPRSAGAESHGPDIATVLLMLSVIFLLLAAWAHNDFDI